MIINFDNSATTFPKPENVRYTALQAIEKFGGNAGRGGHRLSMLTSEAVYSARESVAEFFGAEPENTVFTLNCTYALNMAVQGIMQNGGHMIISSLEHNSVSRPAYRLAEQRKIVLSVAEISDSDEQTLQNFRSLIRSDTKAVVCTLASNVTGQITPFKEIAKMCSERNICFIADGSQACGVIEVKMSDGINILCTSGHKGLYGITGTGILVSDGKYRIPPIIQGGTGSGSADLHQPDVMPESLESGTLNTAGIMTVKAGIDFVKSIGIDRIFAHEDRICRTFISQISKSSEITVYRSPKAKYVPIVSFNVRGMNPERVSDILSEHGYCLRAGFHCSALAHRSLKTLQGTVRFSPSVFSRESDAYSLGLLVRNMTIQEKT